MTVDDTYSLTVSASPEVATTLRVFVAECGRRWDASSSDIDDLRLLATELLANSIETGGSSLRVTLSFDGSRWLMLAEGAGPLRGAERTDGDDVDRKALIGALATFSEQDDRV